MNRCHRLQPLRQTAMQLALCLSLTAGLLAVCTPAQAQQAAIRPFPAKAQLGAMMVTNPPELQMDGRPERLSPGARIRGANNLLVMSSALVGQRLLVVYLREPVGMIHEVWVLSEAEAALAMSRAH